MGGKGKQVMDSQNRVLIAIVLSILVLVAYQKVFVAPSAINRITTVSSEKADQPKTASPTSHSYAPKPEEVSIIENQAIKVELTNNSARIKQIWLKNFKDQAANQPTRLLDEGLTDKFLTGPFLLEDLFSKETKSPTWQIIDKSDKHIKYLLNTPSGTEITKEIYFHNSNYGIGLRLSIKNNAKTPMPIKYKLIGGSSLFVKRGMDERFLNANVKIGQDIKRMAPKGNLKNNEKIYYESPEWIGLSSRYFSLLVEPKQKEEACFIEKEGEANARSGVIIGPITVQPSEMISKEFLLYAGPNDLSEIAKTDPSMKDIITFGFWSSISIVLLNMLKFFNSIFHNYGISIIVLVVIVSGVLFPLTRKSLKSMKEMQAIQPEIEKLRIEHKDKPQKLNKEIMDLYKRHKINPMGGCLPMLFQFPVFIALYNVLIRSVELKGANFLWIKDLSEPDAAFKLPTTLPILGSYLNILPILIIIAMFLQQKISQPKTGQTEQQKIMATIMPIIIGVFFYNLPAGFALYWLVSTVIVLVLQEFVLKTKVTVS